MNTAKLAACAVVLAAGYWALAAGIPAATQPGATASAAFTQPAHWATGYTVRRAGGAITIDEKDHPQEWADAAVLDDFRVPVTDAKPKAPTTVRMLWDDQNLYVRFDTADRDIRSTFTKRTDPLYEQDVVELFLKPLADKGNYYEFEISPKNVVMGLMIAVEHGEGTLEEKSQWEMGIKSAVALDGTLNDSSDTDKSWRVVMSIPWKNLSYVQGQPPKPGEKWAFLACRGDVNEKGGNELSSSSHLPKVTFHMHAAYLPLVFAGK
jgi:hypothetical protein